MKLCSSRYFVDLFLPLFIFFFFPFVVGTMQLRLNFWSDMELKLDHLYVLYYSIVKYFAIGVNELM